jgi:5,10-methylenetetrahydromethanopterin reductase
VRFGIALQGNKAPEEYVAHAQMIDAYAFHVVSVYNDLFFQPAIAPLLVMAPHLRHAQIGPAALNPYTLHPVEIAGQIAFLDQLTGGRAYLGLARGAWLDQIGVHQAHPVSRLRRAILTIKELLRGHQLRYARFRIDVPITVGTWGPRTARMAGEVADEVKIGGSANPAMVGLLRPAIAEGERRAGRPAGSVGICLGAVTVIDVDRARARERARAEVALYAPVVAPLDPTLKGATMAGLIPDDVLDRLAFAGTPADICRQVDELARAGVERVEFGTPHGLDSLEAIRLLGEQVLPSFSS